METLKLQKQLSDSEKIKQMSREDLERIVMHIATTGHCFDNFESKINLSLLDWFRVYATSEEFRTLDKEKQKQVFEHYDYARYTFGEILDLLSEFQISEVYN